MTVIGWPGMERTVIGPGQPNAGAGVTVALAKSEEGILAAVTFRLVTTAVVANRVPVVTITDGTGVAIAIAVGGFAVTANSTADYSFVAGPLGWFASGVTTASGGLPSFPLRDGDAVVLSVGAIDVGDQISRVRVTMWQEPVRPDTR